MSARNQILGSISKNKPELTELPVIDIQQVISYKDLIEQFTNTLTGIGGMVVQISDEQEIIATIAAERAAGNWVADTIWDSTEAINSLRSQSAESLALIEKTYIKGTVGVAENGAIWIQEHQMVNRLLPFICQHLAIILSKEQLVATLHHAYAQIDISEEGFGAFIAGPSKTADIEQSLVIGAHGARSLVVYLVA